MSLMDELAQARTEIKTDSYPITIRELVSLYREGELDIHPEFQRFLRWTPEQKTKLVESILLGIPLPSIFLYQREDGVLDVVDGLQRISTILQFMGELRDENDSTIPMLTLETAQYLPSLEGKCWQANETREGVGDEIQRFFRQEKIFVQVLLRESDDQAKYELFQRINTGGTPLSDQEVRNCILIMVNRERYFWLEKLSREPTFQNCTPVPDRLLAERYDVELALRFIVLHNIDLVEISEISDLGQFLTSEMRRIFSEGEANFDQVQDVFCRTFTVLDASLGDNALRRYSSGQERFSGPFLISAFELVALGVAANIDYVEKCGTEWLREKVKAIWTDSRTDGIYGQGVSTARRLPKTLELGRKFFSEE